MKQDTDRRILKLLEEKRSLSARETAERLGISGASIRRAFSGCSGSQKKKRLSLPGQFRCLPAAAPCLLTEEQQPRISE